MRVSFKPRRRSESDNKNCKLDIRRRSRSTDEDMEASNESINLPIEEPSLEDVAEDTESGESESTNEVAVSEKTLKFKISTEGSVSTGRKSYPGSRKGSRERVQHLTSSELAKVMQKGKLRAGALSFDQQCLTGNRKSFDAPEFLDDSDVSLKKRLEGREEADECVLSKETLNLNKRNSEHSVKVANSEEKKSILKCPFSNEGKLRMNNVARESEEKDAVEVNEDVVSANNSSDNPNSISTEKNSKSDLSDSKNNRSILSRLKQFTDRFGLTVDKDSKFKTLRINSFRNNNQRNTLPKNKKKLESPCCKSLETFEDRRASTLPKTKKLGFGKKGWKYLVTGKEKTECWSSDADVNKLSVANSEPDNQSIPSTSKSQSSCTLNTSPKTDDNSVVRQEKLMELEAEQLVAVANEAESNLI